MVFLFETVVSKSVWFSQSVIWLFMIVQWVTGAALSSEDIIANKRDGSLSVWFIERMKNCVRDFPWKWGREEKGEEEGKYWTYRWKMRNGFIWEYERTEGEGNPRMLDSLGRRKESMKERTWWVISPSQRVTCPPQNNLCDPRWVRERCREAVWAQAERRGRFAR